MDVTVTVLHVEQGVATVQDVGGRTYRTPSLMVVGEDVDAMLLAEEECMAQEYEEARREHRGGARHDLHK